MKRKTTVQLKRDVVRQAAHHLSSYFGFIVPMAQTSEARTPPESRESVRAGFMQIFEEVGSVLGVLTDALHKEDPLKKHLSKELQAIKASPDYQAIVKGLRDETRRAKLYTFKALSAGKSVMPGMETFDAFEVECPQACIDFGSWLLGRFVVVDGKEFICHGVEYRPLKPPFKPGDRIKLVCIPPPAELGEKLPKLSDLQDAADRQLMEGADGVESAAQEEAGEMPETAAAPAQPPPPAAARPQDSSDRRAAHQP